MTLSDQKGDTLNYPKVVLQLPFTETGATRGAGSTAQYRDDYSVVCGVADAEQGGAPVSNLGLGGHAAQRAWVSSLVAGIVLTAARLPTPRVGCRLLLQTGVRLHLNCLALLRRGSCGRV